MNKLLKPKIVCVVGARPNFMKIAPIMAQLRKPQSKLDVLLVHTGQHYDADMKRSFFEQLGIPEPDVDLGVGSGSHAIQTAEVMKRFEPVLDEHSPAAVLVVGDVNSTIACALVATKKGIPVVHVEAGLRSNDRTMPEEINRVLTDQISDLLFITERSATDNLIREGIAKDRIEFVGNVMIDTLFLNKKRAVPPSKVLAGVLNPEKILEAKSGYGVVTMHRPSNVDDPKVLRQLLEVIVDISQRMPLVFPVHPRTRGRIEAANLGGLLASGNIAELPPLGYLELLGLMNSAQLVLTDSGGMQEETTALGIPCLTLRDNTERPITVEQGTNTIVGTDPELIRSCFEQIMSTGGKRGMMPELWDGKAAERIVENLTQWLFNNKANKIS